MASPVVDPQTEVPAVPKAPTKGPVVPRPTRARAAPPSQLRPMGHPPPSPRPAAAPMPRLSGPQCRRSNAASHPANSSNRSGRVTIGRTTTRPTRGRTTMWAEAIGRAIRARTIRPIVTGPHPVSLGRASPWPKATRGRLSTPSSTGRRPRRPPPPRPPMATSSRPVNTELTRSIPRVNISNSPLPSKTPTPRALDMGLRKRRRVPTPPPMEPVATPSPPRRRPPPPRTRTPRPTPPPPPTPSPPTRPATQPAATRPSRATQPLTRTLRPHSSSPWLSRLRSRWLTIPMRSRRTIRMPRVTLNPLPKATARLTKVMISRRTLLPRLQLTAPPLVVMRLMEQPPRTDIQDKVQLTPPNMELV